MVTQQQILSSKEKRRIAIFTNSTFHHTQLLKKTILFLILFCCSSLQIHSQAATDATFTIENGTGLFFVALPDSNCTQIEVAIGTKANLTDVFSHTFEVDQSPTGTLTFTRTGLLVHLGLGALTEQLVYNSKVRLKNQAGTWSDWYEFISN
ncbi:MAG: hypothetical protein IPP71_01705 [Bacteroidetes bacterium]|nr:hypothetical protein [Bacteroidota bacterium]